MSLFARWLAFGHLSTGVVDVVSASPTSPVAVAITSALHTDRHGHEQCSPSSTVFSLHLFFFFPGYHCFQLAPQEVVSTRHNHQLMYKAFERATDCRATFFLALAFMRSHSQRMVVDWRRGRKLQWVRTQEWSARASLAGWLPVGGIDSTDEVNSTKIWSTSWPWLRPMAMRPTPMQQSVKVFSHCALQERASAAVLASVEVLDEFVDLFL